MIITRTPLRVSFLGGGSDYPSFFEAEEGAVLGAAINLYVFVAIIRHTQLVDKQFRLTYRVSEGVDTPSDLEHPVVRAVLMDRGWTSPGLHIATLADVPANTGLGSSSSFTVGLLHALALFNGESPSPEWLAQQAIRIEREVLQEAGGWQDQYHAAYGGLGLYTFGPDNVRVHQLDLAGPIDALNASMVLVPTGGPRRSHDHASETNRQVADISGLHKARRLADLARNASSDLAHASNPETAIAQLADAMNEAWQLKRTMTGSDDGAADVLIEHGLRHGALSGKLCGAGGSGFVLFLTAPGQRARFLKRADLHQSQMIEIARLGSSHGPIDWM